MALVVVILAPYLTVLVRGSTESTRRTLQLRDETSAQDRIVVPLLVTNVNPVTQELAAQLGFRLVGKPAFFVIGGIRWPIALLHAVFDIRPLKKNHRVQKIVANVAFP